MDSLDPPAKKSRRRTVVAPTLEKILFPVVTIERHLDDEGMLTTSQKATLTQSTEAGLAATTRSNGKTYSVARLVFAVSAEDTKSKTLVLKCSLTCLAYFRHEDKVKLNEAKKWVEKGGAGLVDELVAPVYSAAVLELERLIAGTGLPPIRTPLNMPSFVDDAEVAPGDTER
jgi:hypothetical protein